MARPKKAKPQQPVDVGVELTAVSAQADVSSLRKLVDLREEIERLRANAALGTPARKRADAAMRWLDQGNVDMAAWEADRAAEFHSMLEHSKAGKASGEERARLADERKVKVRDALKALQEDRPEWTREECTAELCRILPKLLMSLDRARPWHRKTVWNDLQEIFVESGN